MADGKGLNPMIIGGIVLGLVAVGLVVYFVFFRNKKDDDGSGSGSGSGSGDFGGGAPTFSPPSSGGGDDGGAGLYDVDILNYMGNDANRLTMAAYSLRRQHSSYKGPIVLLKKAYMAGVPTTKQFFANDNGSGLVGGDGETLDQWEGATLLTWYDQSGNSKHASPSNETVLLKRTQATEGKPSFWAFDFSGAKLVLGSNLRYSTTNNIVVYSNASPKLDDTKAVLKDFGSTWANTVFVFSSNISSNYKNFFEEDRNPPLKQSG